MAIHIAICDDQQKDLEYISALVREWAEEKKTTAQLELFPSAEAFLFQYAERKDWDLLLLDIEMGNMDGVNMAKTVRRENEAVQIVFITGYSDYIAEGYEVAALHYLMKPVKPEKLFEVLDRAAEKLRRNEGFLTVQTTEETARLPFYTIRYLDVQKNYVTVHAKADYTVKRTLSEMEAELDRRFFRIGRAAIVNLDLVQRVTKAEVHLSDGTALPLPRGAYELLNRAIIAHN